MSSGPARRGRRKDETTNAARPGVLVAAGIRGERNKPKRLMAGRRTNSWSARGPRRVTASPARERVRFPSGSSCREKSWCGGTTSIFPPRRSARPSRMKTCWSFIRGRRHARSGHLFRQRGVRHSLCSHLQRGREGADFSQRRESAGSPLKAHLRPERGRNAEGEVRDCSTRQAGGLRDSRRRRRAPGNSKDRGWSFEMVGIVNGEL